MAKMPRGWKEPDGKVKIAIKLDQDVFDDVARNAEKRNLSFSDSANEVLKCGLFDLKEAEEL